MEKDSVMKQLYTRTNRCKVVWYSTNGIVALFIVLMFLCCQIVSAQVTVSITADNAYRFGFGTNEEIKYLDPHWVVNCSIDQIFECLTPPPDYNIGAETYTVPLQFVRGSYIYIMAWSDKLAYQGTLAQFSDGNITITTSSQYPWEAFATNHYFNPSCEYDPPGKPSSQLVPELADINNFIAQANSNTGGSSTSITWVSTTGGPGIGQVLFDPGGGAAGVGYHPKAAHDVCLQPSGHFDPSAQWMWFTPMPSIITDPFVVGFKEDGHFPVSEMNEYYIFRVGPLDSLLHLRTGIYIDSVQTTQGTIAYPWDITTALFSPCDTTIRYFGHYDPVDLDGNPISPSTISWAICKDGKTTEKHSDATIHSYNRTFDFFLYLHSICGMDTGSYDIIATAHCSGKDISTSSSQNGTIIGMNNDLRIVWGDCVCGYKWWDDNQDGFWEANEGVVTTGGYAVALNDQHSPQPSSIPSLINLEGYYQFKHLDELPHGVTYYLYELKSSSSCPTYPLYPLAPYPFYRFNIGEPLVPPKHGNKYGWNFGNGNCGSSSSMVQCIRLCYCPPVCDCIPAGWNMISIAASPEFIGWPWGTDTIPDPPDDPPIIDPPVADEVFPGILSNAFTFSGGYKPEITLQHGIGYWIKFPAGYNQKVSGYPLLEDTIPVQSGWNMVGSLSIPISVSSVQSNPPGMITGEFFGYERGYFVTDSIRPFGGYWVKTNNTGQLILSVRYQSEMLAMNAIKIVPTTELPPPPPEGSIASEPVIPTEYGLDQAYPNPFNPSTVIKYGLPQQSHVTLSVYSTLGQRVALLVDDQQDAGYREVTFNANKLSSGVYFYRLQAGTFVDTKKLLLLK